MRVLVQSKPSHLESDTRVTLFSLKRKQRTRTQGQSLGSAALLSQARRNQKVQRMCIVSICRRFLDFNRDISANASYSICFGFPFKGLFRYPDLRPWLILLQKSKPRWKSLLNLSLLNSLAPSPSSPASAKAGSCAVPDSEERPAQPR